MSIAGEPKSIKNLRTGDLLIQCAKESHEKSLLQMKTFCGLFVCLFGSLRRINPCGSLASDDIKQNMMKMEKVKIYKIK